DAGDETAGGRVAVVHVPRRERRQLEERGAGIEQPLDAVAHEQLAARGVALHQVGPAALLHAGESLAQLGRERAVMRGVGLELFALDVEVGLELLHAAPAKVRCGVGTCVARRRDIADEARPPKRPKLLPPDVCGHARAAAVRPTWLLTGLGRPSAKRR